MTRNAIILTIACLVLGVQVFLFSRVRDDGIVENERINSGKFALNADGDGTDGEASIEIPLAAELNVVSTSLMQYFDEKYSEEAISPVVSIITPIYRFDEIKIKNTVASIQHQSLQNWEWIIVDDAEEENVFLKAFVTDLFDTRVRLLRNGHLGLPGARNYAVSQARGMFFYPLDDDDLVGHHTLEMLFFSLVSNPAASFVNGYSYGFGHKNYKWPHGYGKPEGFLTVNLGTYALMVRKDHWSKVGGYDSSRSGGLEDWDFTLKLMNQHMWGYTIPEYVFWYRTRESHTDRWTELSEAGLKNFIKNVPVRYPNLAAKQFPKLPCPGYSHFQPIDTSIVQSNGITLEPLPKTKKRLMLIVPWLIVGGADKFNRDFVRGIVAAGWEVTVVCTLKAEHTWRSAFAKSTSDIFILSNFIPYAHYPRFIRHLLHSRNPDVVMTSNSGLGYNLIPFLTSSCPQAVFVDYAHAEHMSFFHGGWARMAKGLSPWYDINFVASTHLRNWMVMGGVSPDKAKILHVGVYADEYARNYTSRHRFRAQLGVAETTKVVTLAARLDAMKQPVHLCHVASEILKDVELGADVHFVVAGDGELRKPLETCLSEKDIKSKFTLLGYVSIERMKAVMSASDILFLSSQMEGIPCVFYEAMAAGIPVIGPGVGGIAELVLNDITGYVINVKNGTEFDYNLISVEAQIKLYTDAVRKILSSPERAHEMGKAAEHLIQTEFNIDGIIKQFIKIVEEKSMEKNGREGVGNVFCRAHPQQAHKLNEEASMGLALGLLHMDSTPAYCPFK